MQITAAVKYADRDSFSIEQLELEPPRAKEILVKIAFMLLSLLTLYLVFSHSNYVIHVLADFPPVFISYL